MSLSLVDPSNTSPSFGTLETFIAWIEVDNSRTLLTNDTLSICCSSFTDISLNSDRLLVGTKHISIVV